MFKTTSVVGLDLHAPLHHLHHHLSFDQALDTSHHASPQRCAPAVADAALHVQTQGEMDLPAQGARADAYRRRFGWRMEGQDESEQGNPARHAAKRPESTDVEDLHEVCAEGVAVGEAA